MTSYRKILTSLSFFQFIDSFEHSGSRIPNAQSVKLRFFLIATIFLQKLETELKNLKHSSQIIALSKGFIFAKITLIILQKTLTSAITCPLFLLQVYFNVNLLNYYYETTIFHKVYGRSSLKPENFSLHVRISETFIKKLYRKT